MDLSRIAWRKSSYSSSNGGACIEVGTIPHTIAVRDSKNPSGATLAFTCNNWQAFTVRAKALDTSRNPHFRKRSASP
jgi:hypothetical protein